MRMRMVERLRGMGVTREKDADLYVSQGNGCLCSCMLILIHYY